MNLKEATELKNKNEHLIGQKYRSGTIDQIIIQPKNDKELDFFMKSYLRTMNAEKSLKPFLNSDLQVFVLFNKAEMKKNSVIWMTEIESLLNENLDVKL